MACERSALGVTPKLTTTEAHPRREEWISSTYQGRVNRDSINQPLMCRGICRLFAVVWLAALQRPLQVTATTSPGGTSPPPAPSSCIDSNHSFASPPWISAPRPGSFSYWLHYLGTHQYRLRT